MISKEQENFLKQAADFIKDFEGFSEELYICPGGEKTFGYGTLLKNHPEVNLPITKDSAFVFLMEDVKNAVEVVEKLVEIPLNNNQKIALTSFVYNLGKTNFSRSTLLKKINANNLASASKEFERWVYADKKILPGLVDRREKEKRLFFNKIF